jgi:Transposase and inactivated derivatives
MLIVIVHVMSRPKGKETTVSERKLILRLFKQNKSYGEISKLIGRSRSTIQYIIKHCEKENMLESSRRSGRPEKLTEREKRKVMKLVRSNPHISAPAIVSELKQMFNIDVHPDTVRRTIHQHGYHSRTARKKPYISAANRQKRIEFAQQYIKRPISFWNKVLFTDESIFHVFGSGVDS